MMEFQLLSCTCTQRSAPYHRASIELEIGVVSLNASHLPSSQTADGSTPSSALNMNKDHYPTKNPMQESGEKNSASAWKYLRKDGLHPFSLEASQDGSVVLTSLPTSLLGTPLKRDEGTKAGQGKHSTGIPGFSPLAFLFSTETGKINVPGSVRVVSCNQYVNAPMPVYERCFQSILQSATRLAHASQNTSSLLTSSKDEEMTFSPFSSPAISFSLQLSVEMPRVTHDVAGRGRGRERGRGRGQTRGTWAKEDESGTEEGIEHTAASLMPPHTPSLPLPDFASSRLKGNVANPTTATDHRFTAERHTSVVHETSFTPRRGRGRPPGARNKKGSDEVKEGTPPTRRVPVSRDDFLSSSATGEGEGVERKPMEGHESAPRRGRGRPRKTPAGVEPTTTSHEEEALEDTSEDGVGRSRMGSSKRGRKTKASTPLGSLNDPSIPVTIEEIKESSSQAMSTSVRDIIDVVKSLVPPSTKTSKGDSSSTSGSAYAEKHSNAQRKKTRGHKGKKAPPVENNTEPSLVDRTSSSSLGSPTAVEELPNTGKTEEEKEEDGDRIRFSGDDTSSPSLGGKRKWPLKSREKTVKKNASRLPSAETENANLPDVSTTSVFSAEEYGTMAAEAYFKQVGNTSSPTSDATGATSVPSTTTSPLVAPPVKLPLTVLKGKKKLPKKEASKGGEEEGALSIPAPPSRVVEETIFQF